MIPFACAFPDQLPEPCSFYTQCLEASTPCEAGAAPDSGRDSYAVTYGFKYCSRFTDLQPRLSSGGREWVASTRSCLQKELVPFLPGGEKWGSSCKVIRAGAFDSHPFCYLSASPSFCRLPVFDYPVILSLFEIPDLATGESVKQMVSVIDGCLRRLPFTVAEDAVASPEGADIGASGEEIKREKVLRVWRERLSLAAERSRAVSGGEKGAQAPSPKTGK